ncbi:MAG: hypothetical protein VW496_03260 [Pelagibacteraceae bacterium]|jgi:hypothetical protein
MRYPDLSYYKRLPTKELEDLYSEVQQWASKLVLELDTRDTEEKFKQAQYIQTAVTTSEIGRPLAGSIVYSLETGKYYGWNALTSAWDAFN